MIQSLTISLQPHAEPPPPAPFDVVTTQETLASAIIWPTELICGHVLKHESEVNFIPTTALWDGKGIRIGLEDERHPVMPVATARVKMALNNSLFETLG